MENTESKLIKIYNPTHLIFETDILLYIGTRNLINYNFVGENFYLNKIFKRYLVLKYKNNCNGLWNLINISISISENSPFFYFFKNNITNEIIQTTDKILLDEGLLFANYDLELIETFKTIQWTPDLNTKDLCNYIKVKILNIYDGGYLGTLNNNVLINIRSLNLPNYYIGKEIFIELLPKYLSLNIFIKTNNIINNNYYKNLTIGNKITPSNLDITKTLSIRFYTDNNLKIAGISQSFITDINIGSSYTYKINKLYVTRFAILNDNSNFTLISIVNYIELLIYLFEDNIGNIYYYLIETNPDLSFLLGRKFDIDSKILFLGSDISFNNNGKYEFISVIDNIYNFKNINNNEINSFLINNQSTPTESNIGKIFDMNIFKIYFLQFV